MTSGLSSAWDVGAHPWAPDLTGYYPVLTRLTPPQVRAFCQAARAVVAPAGAIAFDEDSPCLALTFLTRGSIRVGRQGHSGREILLYRVLPGESCILSVSCLLGRANYAARGVVEEELRGIAIPATLFEALVAENGAFRRFIFELFGARVTALMQLVEEVAFHRLDQRVARLLLRRFQEIGARELDTTHQELADEVGSVREIVSRVLQALAQEGGIGLSRGKVTLLDADALREVAGFGDGGDATRNPTA